MSSTTLGEALDGVERVMVTRQAGWHHQRWNIAFDIKSEWLSEDTPVTVEGNRILDLDGTLICEIVRTP